MKTMLITVALIALLSQQVMANEAHERMYLIQMMNQLDAIKPLINSASQEQEKDTRIKFHYISYRDANGLTHNGLLEDINAIQKGIQDKLSRSLSEPRSLLPIKGDYLDVKNVKSHLIGIHTEVEHAK